MRVRKAILVTMLLGVVVGTALMLLPQSDLDESIRQKISGRKTVADIVAEIEHRAEERLRPRFERVGVAYPPTCVTLIGLKEEKQLELWAGDEKRQTFIHSYPIVATSGKAGPKLREGDRQVPEGVYAVCALNPNSAYHLSLKLDYPNAFDRRHATEEGRTEPGGDIFIHGGNLSIGCLAMGDEAIEELFLLAAKVGLPNIKAILAPRDPRRKFPLEVPTGAPGWTKELYGVIAAELNKFRQ